MLAVSIYRAATQSITHDEARVFLLYMQGSVRHAFTYTGIQNHVLQAFLSRLVLTVLPASAFAIRIPTLVATAIYCAAVIWIAERLFDNRWMRWTVVATLTLHPYLLDFFSAARGYGLMLAFLLLATALLLPGVTSLRERTATAAAAVCLGLAIAATTACMFAVAGIICAVFISRALSQRWRDAVLQTAALGLIAVVVASIPLANQLYRTTGKDYEFAFNLGGNNLLLQTASLVRASVSRVNPYLTAMTAVTAGQLVALVVALAVVAASIVSAVTRLSRWHSLDARDRAVVWLGTMVTGMTVATIAAHLVMHVTYPQGRMALYWIPFVTLTASAAWACTRAGSIPQMAGWAISLVVLVVDLSLFNVTTYADWIADAPDAALVEHMIDDHADSGRHVTVGGSWILEPSMNFYRATRGLAWMNEMERRSPEHGDDYYVLIKADRGEVSRLRLRVLYEDPQTGTLVAATGTGIVRLGN